MTNTTKRGRKAPFITYACTCGKAFPTIAALGAHQTKAGHK